MFVEGREFLHIDQAGWVAKESTSEEDNRMSKVQEMLSEKYQKDSFSIYVKQLTTGKEAGINQDEKDVCSQRFETLLSLLYARKNK